MDSSCQASSLIQSSRQGLPAGRAAEGDRLILDLLHISSCLSWAFTHNILPSFQAVKEIRLEFDTNNFTYINLKARHYSTYHITILNKLNIRARELQDPWTTVQDLSHKTILSHRDSTSEHLKTDTKILVHTRWRLINPLILPRPRRGSWSGPRGPSGGTSGRAPRTTCPRCGAHT